MFFLILGTKNIENDIFSTIDVSGLKYEDLPVLEEGKCKLSHR